MAFLIYAVLAVVMTWPLAAGLTHDVPGDFGDPLFTSWVLAWDASHLGHGWWNANIFAPHPLALAYSEHFLPQALQVLPIYALTKNPILCYNLLFLSTFALAGLGMFLLGRELTGSAAAGLVAGLAFAFAPYRIANIPHLQVLSSAWMPFVLFGLHRHFATGRLRPLAGAAAAWLVQNLSCGYYLLFFTPVVFMYIAWELARHRRWSDRRALMQTGIAIAIVFAATVPFLLPYVELRRLGFSPRSLAETRRFSADVYAYLTADPNLRLWGSVAQAWPKSEGLLFPGLTIVVLAAIGIGRWKEKTAETAEIAEKTFSQRSLRSLPVFSRRDRSAHHHAVARLFDQAARNQDHQPLARARGLRHRRRDRSWRVARRSREGARMAVVIRRHLHRDHAVCLRDVARPRDPRDGPQRGDREPVRGVL